MSDEKPQFVLARRRAAGKAGRAERIKRREAFFDLLVSGRSVEQIAQATKTSASAAPRATGQALAVRRFDAPWDFARLALARPMEALRCADESLEEGDIAAIAPSLEVMAPASRLCGLAAGPLRLAPSAPAAKFPRNGAPPLALSHAAAALDERFQPSESRAMEVLTP